MIEIEIRSRWREEDASAEEVDAEEVDAEEANADLASHPLLGESSPTWRVT